MGGLSEPTQTTPAYGPGGIEYDASCCELVTVLLNNSCQTPKAQMFRKCKPPRA